MSPTPTDGPGRPRGVRRRDLLKLPLAGLAAEREAEPPRTAAPRVYIMAFGPDEATEFPVEQLEALRMLRGRFPVLWVNVDGVEHAPTLEAIGEIFGLHRLALGDVTETGQHARAESFDDHLLVIAKMVRLCPELDVEQVSTFVGSDYVITFQERPGDSLEPVRERIRRGTGRIRRGGPDYLAYSLLDAMVGHCFPVIERYMERLDEVEAEVLHHPDRGVMPRLHAVRRDLLTLRRAVYPMRDALRSLVTEPPEGLVAPETGVYLRDVQDQAVQVVDLVESCRELAGSLADLYLSLMGHRTNDIMKVLTIFAAIFIPLGFITGLYGMNVDGPPGWLRDLTIAEAAMAAITLGLILFFWRRGWLEGPG